MAKAELSWLSILACASILGRLAVSITAANVASDEKWQPALAQQSNCANTPESPICATDGRAFHIFPHACALHKYNRDNYHQQAVFYTTHMERCRPRCDFICLDYYRPLCAKDARTGRTRSFDSRCRMALHGCLHQIHWLALNEGLCESSGLSRSTIGPKKPKSRPVPCAKVFKPVCAILNGVKSTFVNECQVNEENVNRQQDWRIFSKGLCAEDYMREHQPSRSLKPRPTPRIRQPEKGSVLSITPVKRHSTGSNIPVRNVSQAQQLRQSIRRTNDIAISNKRRDKDTKMTCDKNYNPICISKNGFNFTLANECYLKLAKIEDPGSDWKFISKGECEAPRKNNAKHATRPRGFRLMQDDEDMPNANIDNQMLPRPCDLSKVINQAFATTEIPNSRTFKFKQSAIPKFGLIPRYKPRKRTRAHRTAMNFN